MINGKTIWGLQFLFSFLYVYGIDYINRVFLYKCLDYHILLKCFWLELCFCFCVGLVGEKDWYINLLLQSSHVIGRYQKSGAPHKVRKFYTSTIAIERDSEREMSDNRLPEMYL